jgi:GntR family transcriptional regulator, transcriptional repressor for pyruvate dehydrogenase complex
MSDEGVRMLHKLKPIKPKRISDQVFEQLRELIFRGEFKPGEKIMTERELSEAFDVSRTSVRDAINKLVVMGLLEQKQGQGTFVRSPGGRDHKFMSEAMRSQNATLLDLLEVRMGLECNSAALAAQRAVERDITFMEDSLRELNEEMAAGRLGASADTSFHMAIAYATHNPLQVYIMKRFYDFLFYGIEENLIKLYEEPEQLNQISAQHRDIVDAIKDHDPQKAYSVTKRHIEYVMQRVGEQKRDAREMRELVADDDALI